MGGGMPGQMGGGMPGQMGGYGAAPTPPPAPMPQSAVVNPFGSPPGKRADDNPFASPAGTAAGAVAHPFAAGGATVAPEDNPFL
jgi:hypothetical protein